MLKHFTLIALRNFKQHPGSSFINLLSLTIGLTCALLLYIWVNDELRVDKFHEKNDRLFQVLQTDPTPNGMETDAYTPGPLAKALADEIPEVEHAASVIPYEWFEEKNIFCLMEKTIFSFQKINLSARIIFSSFLLNCCKVKKRILWPMRMPWWFPGN